MLFLTTLVDATKYFGTYAAPWAYPSPWGSVAAIAENGIIGNYRPTLFSLFKLRGLSLTYSGFWSQFWQSYFSYGFRAFAELVILSSVGGRNKIISRVARLLIVFILSGTMHFCGSVMMAGYSKSSGQFVFFILQAGGVLVHLLIQYVYFMKNPEYKSVFNIFFCFAWLYSTQSLLLGDFLLAGLWDYRVIQLSRLYKGR